MHPVSLLALRPAIYYLGVADLRLRRRAVHSLQATRIRRSGVVGLLGLSVDCTIALDVCVYSNNSPCCFRLGEMFSLLAVGLREVDQEAKVTFPNCHGFLAGSTKMGCYFLQQRYQGCVVLVLVDCSLSNSVLTQLWRRN